MGTSLGVHTHGLISAKLTKIHAWSGCCCSAADDDLEVPFAVGGGRAPAEREGAVRQRSSGWVARNRGRWSRHQRSPRTAGSRAKRSQVGHRMPAVLRDVFIGTRALYHTEANGTQGSSAAHRTRGPEPAGAVIHNRSSSSRPEDSLTDPDRTAEPPIHVRALIPDCTRRTDQGEVALIVMEIDEFKT